MSVFSPGRVAAQPEFALPRGLKFNARQRMDGLKLLKLLPGNCAPLIFFDPQYRSVLDKQRYGNEGARQKKRALLPQMSGETIRQFLAQSQRALMPGGHLMLWVDKFIFCAELPALLAGSQLQVVDMLTWNKKRMGMGYRTRRVSEHIAVLQKPPVRAKGVWQDHGIPDVWDEKVSTAAHPHAKPVRLQERLIAATTNEGDIVIDPAAGGYSVLEAAQNTGRRFLGCDMEDLCSPKLTNLNR